MASILLIEDDQVLRSYLCDILELFDHSVSVASGGDEGLKEFKNNSPTDIVITDIVMAEGEGIETVREIQKIAPGQPIIAISAHPDYLESISRLGATRTLLKPFGIEAFCAVVDEVIETRQRELAGSN